MKGVSSLCPASIENRAWARPAMKVGIRGANTHFL
jgi:hypothetical protein